ncbi:MAG: IPT/TIG domain-containing protein [Longimicrobiales bacterium]
MKLQRLSLIAGLLSLAACDGGNGGGPVEPPAATHAIAIQGGDQQTGSPATELPQPLQVIVSEEVTEQPAAGVAVSWSVVSGTGATLQPTSSTTDSAGVAATRLRLGPAAGTYRVEARVTNGTNDPVVFTARAVVGDPVITSIEPDPVQAGDTVTVTGTGFGSSPDDVIVRFNGLRGVVVAGTDTELRVAVPSCLPARTVPVDITIGSRTSPAVSITVSAGTAGPLMLPIGGVQVFAEPADLGCISLAPQQSGTRFLLVLQNATTVAGAELPFELVGLASGVTTTAESAGPARAALPSDTRTTPLPPQQLWENRLRRLEREQIRGVRQSIPWPQARARAQPQAVPAVGDRRSFNVLNEQNTFTAVTAEVMHVSQHAVLYQDLDAPAAGLTTADFVQFAAQFDDPIFPTDVSVFGEPSDIDDNDRIIILFTPVVNELTERGTQGFVAGYFYGCDLAVFSSSCADANRGEIFYTLVPDPDGVHSDPRSRDDILRTVPPTLAHEFQHMIHFNQRHLILGAFAGEALWLSEGLAHMAEDVVGAVFAQRGDLAVADQFERANYTRAFFYLGTPNESPEASHEISLLAEGGFGTLEQRGAAWLVLKYLAGHHGQTILGELTRTTLTSTDNVSERTGEAWSATFNDWSVALYADDAPELAGAVVAAEYTFPDIDLRTALFSPSRGGFALQPPIQGFADFAVGAIIKAAAPYYLIVDAGNTSATLNLQMSASGAGQFPQNAKPQIAVLRLR